MLDTKALITARLREASLRPTRQRITLGQLLWQDGNRHVSAEQLHSEAKDAGVPVSMATVYNTLNQFVEAGLLREVVVDSSRTYFDTNTEPHHHFLYESTGMLEDIPAEKLEILKLPEPQLHNGSIASVEVMIRLT